MISGVPTYRSEEEIREWLVEKLVARMHVDRSDLRLDEPLVAHGIDSMQFVVLVGEFEDWLGCRFTANPLVQYPSINALTRFVAGHCQASRPSGEAERRSAEPEASPERSP